MFSLFLLFTFFAWANGDRICSLNKTDLCVGYSGFAKQLPLLQLKSTYDTWDDPGRVNFTFKSWFKNPKKVLQYPPFIVDNRLGGYAGLANITTAKGVLWNGTQLVLNDTMTCLTIMQCQSGPQSFCHPNTNKATLMYHIQKGS